MKQPVVEATQPATSSADRCADRIMEVVPRLMHRIRAEMRANAEPRLTVPQVRALLFIWRHPDASLSGLADHLGASPSTSSVLVERLVRRGFVERAPDPGERRRICLRATAEGAAVVTRARERTRAWLREAIGPLEPADVDRLLRVLDVLETVAAGASPRGATA